VERLWIGSLGDENQAAARCLYRQLSPKVPVGQLGRGPKENKEEEKGLEA
jgi:hypothetical protein